MIWPESFYWHIFVSEQYVQDFGYQQEPTSPSKHYINLVSIRFPIICSIGCVISLDHGVQIYKFDSLLSRSGLGFMGLS